MTSLKFLLSLCCALGAKALAEPTEEGDIFATRAEFLSSIRLENVVVGQLMDYARALESRQALVKRYLRDFEDSLQNAGLRLETMDDDEHALTNVQLFPVLYYLTAKRMTSDLKELVQALKTPLGEAQVLQTVEDQTGSAHWLTENSTVNAIRNILDIHELYGFDVAEFAEGKLFGIHHGLSLSHEHCLEIGKIAMADGKHASAVEWLTASLHRSFSAVVKTAARRMSIIEIYARLQSAVLKHDKALAKHRQSSETLTTEEIMSLDLFHTTVNETDQFHRERIRHHHVVQDTKDLSERSHFRKLCSEKHLQVERVEKSSICWYESSTHPYLRLNPLRVEFLNRSPYMIQIHEFLGPKSSRMFRQAGVSRMKEDQKFFFLANGFDSGINGVDIVEVPAFRRNVDTIVGNIEKMEPKPESILSLSMYTVAGMKDDDMTWFIPPGAGPRLSIFVHLNNPAPGAYTTFPGLGVAVEPMEGSALFLFERYGDRQSPRTCPIISDQKWVAIKTISGKIKNPFPVPSPY